jgi:segregation and condensation protein A
LNDPADTEVTGAERGAIGYEVRLATFEGPLDLLLHLIQQHELDIMDIPIGFVTEKYVEYIFLMQELNIDIASEYLVMAATLAHMKSKLMLPTLPSDQDDEEGEPEDPRAELVRRLLEYQKYKLAAATIADRSILGRDVFVRGAPGPAIEGEPPLAPVSLFKLLESFQAVLDRAKKTLDHEIEYERISITDRINQLSDVLQSKRRLGFEELFEGDKTRADLIVTFLALLEMTRLRMTRLYQEGPLDPIFVELSVSDDDDEQAPARVEPDTPVVAAEPPDPVSDEPQ